MPKQGRTIAVDPKVIPYGSRVEINGHVYVAEDCGGAIKNKRIDIYFDSHARCNQFGVQYADVYLVK
jgi:3D (Asp-Asp-Asp) domain-containing protein